MRRSVIWLAVLFLAALFVFAPPIAQPQDYHAFADDRELVRGIPNTLNVLSNLAFVSAGLFGVLTMLAPRRFGNPFERWDAIVLFAGTLLTAIGSAIYHLHPNDATLVYDRCGMIVGFMSFLSMMIHRHDGGGRWLLPLLLAVGATSIVWWRAFDDLRPYVWVQFFPILAVMTMVMLDRHDAREVRVLCVVLVMYTLAKIFEILDRQVFSMTHEIISGHTLKHVSAAAAPFAIALWIRKR